MCNDREPLSSASAAFRLIAFFLAVVCAWTSLGSLVVCLFTLPEAWFMVLLWAVLAGVLGWFALRGRLFSQ